MHSRTLRAYAEKSVGTKIFLNIEGHYLSIYTSKYFNLSTKM